MRRGGSRLRIALAALCALAGLAALAIPASAGPEDRLRTIEDKRQEAQAKLDRLNAKVDDVGSQVRALDAQRAEAQAKVDDSEAKLAELDRNIRREHRTLVRAQKRVAFLSEELLVIRERLGRRMDVFTERAVAAYKAGPGAYLDGLLGAETFNDLLDRFAYYESALNSDSEILGDITALRDDLEGRLGAVEDKQAEIAHAKLSLEADRAEIERLRAERAAALEVVQGALDQKEALLGEYQGDQQRLEEIIAQFQRESSQIESILAARAALSGPLPVGGGQLLWPANGPVVSGFGMRKHPIFGDTRMHSGIDIAAGYGSPVIAADGGQVIYVGVMSGYGNVVIIDHGGGLATTYNHLSSFAVSSGQPVTRGALIAAVGCTGYCTGPHLHFEVRVNGTAVDPMPFLE
jgi:murein DD-endopeptidase MepM/ murein hydrolase activator NlpD